MSPSEKFENVLFKTVTSVFINQQQQTFDAQFTTAPTTIIGHQQLNEILIAL